MSRLLRLGRALRHAPGLRRAEKFWSLFRPAYRWLLDPFGRGVLIRMGGRPIRVPPALLSTNSDWSRYEDETLTALGAWLDAQTGPVTMLDIGSSLGVLTSFAVQVSPRVNVIAFDSDLTSLRALEAVVPAGALGRVRRVEGLLGREHTSGQSLEAAVAATRHRLPDIAPAAAINHSHFLCFGESGADAVPHHQLDGLLAEAAIPAPVLLKCDVEGAELLVLGGAVEFLRRVRPALLLSVHPPLLPRFGQTTDDVAGFLREHGYGWRLLARDHEEHWWCDPIPR